MWVYLGFFNFANPVLYACACCCSCCCRCARPTRVRRIDAHCLADPAEVQTYSLRSKGLLVWNTVNQCLGVYCTYVDAIALDKIGASAAVLPCLHDPRLTLPLRPASCAGTYTFIEYMPLVVIQWFLVYYCAWLALSACLRVAAFPCSPTVR